MSYEATLKRNFSVTTGNDAQIRYERMTKEERAEYDAKMKARNDADNARIKAEQQAKKDALEAAHQADEAQRRAARETEARDRARRLWAGDDASFARQWPAMYETLLAQQTTEQLQRAGKEQFDYLASKF